MAAAGMSRTVVVGFDGSAAALAGVREAFRLAGGGTVVVVHARAAPPPRMSARWQELLAAADVPQAQAALRDIAHDEIPELKEGAWETRVADGAPADVLAEVARDFGAELIVVGSRGHGVGPALGSVSAALIRNADRPVVVIPPRAVKG